MGSYGAKLKKKTEETGGKNLAPNPKSGGFEEKFTLPELSEKLPDKITEIEKQIFKLNDRTWETIWHIGHRLNEINIKFLNETSYKSISEYALETFEFSQSNTSNYMNISANFSLNHARNFGSKLRLLLPLDSQTREKYLEWFEKDNPSFRDIEEKIKQSTSAKKIPKKKVISISNKSISIDLLTLGKKINKNKVDEFERKLNDLINEFSD